MLPMWTIFPKLYMPIFIDETFFSVVESKKILKDGKALRGLLKNQYYIGIGYDETHTIAIVWCVGKTS